MLTNYSLGFQIAGGARINRGRTASGTFTATALLDAMPEDAKIFTVFLAGVWGVISAIIIGIWD